MDNSVREQMLGCEKKSRCLSRVTCACWCIQNVSQRVSLVSRISFGCCGRFTLAELLSFSLSVLLVLIWVLTGHWLLMDGASACRYSVFVCRKRM